jgi:uncharacterized protein YciI
MKRNILLFTSLLISFTVNSQGVNHVFVILNSKPDKEVISKEREEELQRTHLENIGKMAEEGKLIVAGPFDGGGGIFILKTGDKAQANQWLQTDPAIRAKRWDVEILPVDFLRGGACLANEPYEMVTYHYIRVKYINDIANYKTNQQTVDIWYELAKLDSIIMLGAFMNQEGGVLIADRPIDNSNFDAFSDQIELKRKNLWVAKGSFCE